MSFILKACLCADHVFNLKEMVRVDLNWYIGSFLPFSTSVVPSLLFATHSVMIIDVHERLSYKGIDCAIRISSLPNCVLHLNSKKPVCSYRRLEK